MTGEKSSPEGSFNGSRQWQGRYFQAAQDADSDIADLVPRANNILTLQSSPAIRVPEKAS